MRVPWCLVTAVLAVSATGLGASASASGTPARPALLLTARAVDGVALGRPEPTALRDLRALLGPRGTLTRDATNVNCGYDAIATWPAMTAFFFRGRFAGYAYGPDRTRPAPGAVATGGLRLGETTTQLRRLYGRRLRLSGEQGGAYFVATPAGRIDGFLTDELQRPDARVASIDAGDVGCPAMSP